MGYLPDQTFFRNLEEPWKPQLPTKQFYIIRVDGRAFHTWTRGLDKPFDSSLRDAFLKSTISLLSQVSGALCAFFYSDEISIVLTDRLSENSQVWFGGTVTKISSVSASIVTAEFNRHFDDKPVACFDARVFSVEDAKTVQRYLLYRARDCYRNGVTSIAQMYYSHNELLNKNMMERLHMLRDKGVSVEDYHPHGTLGTFVSQEQHPAEVTYVTKSGEHKVSKFMRNLWTPQNTEVPEVAFENLYDKLVAATQEPVRD